jgi:hypothetical protein
MTAEYEEGSAAESELPADPFDPVAFEARLAAARLRRNSALAAQSAVRDARPPAPALAAAPPHPLRLVRGLRRRPAGIWLAAGIAAGACLALLASVLAPPPAAPTAVAPAPARVIALPAPAGTVPAVEATTAGPAALPPVQLAIAPIPDPAAEAATPGPAPRPAGHRVSRGATRSARNAPKPITPPQALRLIVRDLNAATLGRTAAALGVRERVAVPGVPLAVTLDRRGLRLSQRPVPRRPNRR